MTFILKCIVQFVVAMALLSGALWLLDRWTGE